MIPYMEVPRSHINGQGIQMNHVSEGCVLLRGVSKKAKCLLCITGIAYCMILLYVLFFRSIGETYPWTYAEYLEAMHNFIPLKSVYVLLTTPVISKWVIMRFIVNFLGNIVLFIPWGILLPFYLKKVQSFKRFIALTTVALFSIETIQIFTMLGSFDIEDIFLNMTGACIGFAGFCVIIRKNKFHDKKAMN